MLIAHLILRPAPGRRDHLITYYLDHHVIEGGLSYGLLRGELVVPTGSHQLVGIASAWPSQQRYDGWLHAPQRRELIDGLTALLLDTQDAITGWTHHIPDISPDAPLDTTAIAPGIPNQIRHTVVASYR